MNTNLAALAVGVLFGLGLSVAGMTDPGKVLGFLDIAGDWDASLAVVMAAGLAVNAIAYRLTMRREKPLFAAAFQVPTRRDIDRPLVLGAVLFGIGWGIAGICPGPAFASLGVGAWTGAAPFEPAVLVFLAAMIAGMGLHSATQA